MKRLLFFLLLTALPVLPAHAVTLNVEAPKNIEIGQPFTVNVSSDRPLDKLLVEWDGASLTLELFDSRSVSVLLGTDVVSSAPGERQLRITKLGLSPAVASLVVLVEQRTPPQDRLLQEEVPLPTAKERRRSLKECAEIVEAMEMQSPVSHLELPLILPASGRILNIYSLQGVEDIDPLSPHRGIDFQTEVGEPVQAVAPGKVVLVANHYYAGRLVIIDHGLGVMSMYMHLDDQLVAQGRMVEAGEVIGHAGQTGHVGQAKLHFALSILGNFVDPTSLFHLNR